MSEDKDTPDYLKRKLDLVGALQPTFKPANPSVAPPKESAIGWLLGLALAAFLVGLGFYRHSENVKEDKERAARRAEIEAHTSRISGFASRHNAVMDWQKANASKIGRVYTAELTPLLVRGDGRPVFLIAKVDDVSTTQGHSVIYLDARMTLTSGLRFRLECTPDQGRLVMGYPSWNNWYAVIAQIQSVGSVEKVLHDADANSDELASIPLAVGRCVDLMHVSFDEYREFTKDERP
jgi:hypothetical protein